jgi:hypothetical protein
MFSFACVRHSKLPMNAYIFPSKPGPPLYLLFILYKLQHVAKQLCKTRGYPALMYINLVVGFDVFTAVTTKNVSFWDVVSCGSCKYRRLGETRCSHLQGRKNPRTKNSVSN